MRRIKVEAEEEKTSSRRDEATHIHEVGVDVVATLCVSVQTVGELHSAVVV